MIVAIFTTLGCVVALASLVGIIKMLRTIKMFHQREKVSVPQMMKDLPSVSVCIPVRNEEHAMTRCLEDVLASRYPKMEILVCDDSSIDETPGLIKMFARDGVRFIEGPELSEGWLGKNAALNKLLAEASGRYVLFLDVDTRIKPDTIGQLIAYAEQTGAGMVSALPLRYHSWRASVWLAPLRYFWKMLIHSSKRPIVASTAWLVDRKYFKSNYGDLEIFKGSTEPETDIAKLFAKDDKYRFLISHNLLGVSYEKKLSSQLETSVRLCFPAINFSVFRAMLAIVGLLMYVALPFSLLIFGLVRGEVLQIVMALLCMALGYALYLIYLFVVWRRGAAFCAALLPLLVILEVAVIVQSTLAYNLGTVTWKGRPIKLK